MTTPVPPRLPALALVRVSTSRVEPPSRVQRLLLAVGADPDFAEAVLGDLAEEFAERLARDGIGAARWWYAREAARSAPHLLGSAIRHARRHRRALLATWLAAFLLPPAVALAVLLTADGPPARLVPGAGDADGIIINNVRPVRLPVRVLDADGDPLEPAAVRFQLASGAPISVSPDGVVTCTEPGDATVRASLGALTTELRLRCRPVRTVRTDWFIQLVAGGPARELRFEALGTDGQPVTLLTGQVAVSDSTVATLDGLRVRPLAPGVTDVTVRLGDRAAFTRVFVHPRVSSPEGIGPGEMGAVPVRLTGGEMRRWRLAASPVAYHLTMLPNRDEQPTLGFAILGAYCTPAMEPRSYVCLALRDATLIVYHPRQADPAQELRGTLAVWRPESP